MESENYWDLAEVDEWRNPAYRAAIYLDYFADATLALPLYDFDQQLYKDVFFNAECRLDGVALLPADDEQFGLLDDIMVRYIDRHSHCFTPMILFFDKALPRLLERELTETENTYLNRRLQEGEWRNNSEYPAAPWWEWESRLVYDDDEPDEDGD